MTLNTKSLDEMIKEAIARKKREQGYNKGGDTSVPDPDTTERLGPDSEDDEKPPILRRQKRKTMHQAEDSDTELEVDKVINKRTVTEYLVGYRGSGKEMTAQWVR